MVVVYPRNYGQPVISGYMHHSVAFLKGSHQKTNLLTAEECPNANVPWLSVYTQPNEHPLFEINKLTLTDIPKVSTESFGAQLIKFLVVIM